MKSVSSDFQTPRRGLKKEGIAKFPYNQLQGVWKLDEALFQVFDIASQNILGQIQSKSSPNFMIIKITSPNLLHNSGLLCFLLVNY